MIEGDEFIYILINRSLPGLVKIGRTDRSVETRVRELSAATGVPTEFTIFREFRVRDSVGIESAVHQRLKDYRLSENREFFSIEPETAAEVIGDIVGSDSTPSFEVDAEDELLARATELAGRFGKVWPSVLSSALSITHVDAERIIALLRGRGIIDKAGRAKFTGRPRATVSEPLSPREVDIADNDSMPDALSGTYKFPPLGLLREHDWDPKIDEEEHQQNVESLLRIFDSHGMEVALGEIHVGPVLTRYEFIPSLTVRLERLPQIETAVIERLNVSGARVLGSIPGRHAIGVELPNKVPLGVPLRSILESEDWCSQKSELPVALGKDVGGQPIILDLARSPSILIAGAQREDRGMVINTVLASILYSQSPASVRLLLFDPTARELMVYNTLPHGLIPVVIDPAKLPAVFQWLIAEMVQRFQIFARVGVRGLVEFNRRDLCGSAEECAADDDWDFPPPARLPHIILIINDLADSVLASPRVLGELIGRLAQHGVAAGIHLIAATERASTEVITNPIQEAMPARIVLKSRSQLDSRVALGVKGAESLLGGGDMLYRADGASVVRRAQVSLVAPQEMIEICKFMKRNGPPQWAMSVQQFVDRQARDEAVVDDDAGCYGEEEDLGNP